MTCQLIVKKARRQLLAILEKSYQSNYLTQLTTKSERCHRPEAFPRGKLRSLRCFASVPQPPSFRGDLLGRSSIEEQEQCEDVDIAIDGISCGDRESCSRENDLHVPVMVEEVLACLDLKENQLVVDMTFGAGGHARHILSAFPNTRYLAVDRDPMAFGFAQEFAGGYRDGQVTPLLSKFSELPVHFERIGVKPGDVDCFLMDLGVSSMQFDSAGRGFAISKDGPLDMRMDGQCSQESLTAADVVNTLEPPELARILKKYGEEKLARPIAHAIMEARWAFGPFTRTKQLADVIQSVFDSKYRHDKLHRHSHVATKTFQALRIFVNDELNELNNGLEVAQRFLKPNGRCVAISFHSLEDRIVKRHFHGIEMDLSSNISIHSYFRNSRISFDNKEIEEKFLSRDWQPMRRKITEPSSEEVRHNPRSRSARLRAAVKTAKE